MRSTPPPGDLIIGRDIVDGRLVFTLSIAPDPPQVRYPTYDQALSAARTWALHQSIGVWDTEDGTAFTALEVPRQDAPPAASETRRDNR